VEGEERSREEKGGDGQWLLEVEQGGEREGRQRAASERDGAALERERGV
jgi:hypothetical protein